MSEEDQAFVILLKKQPSEVQPVQDSYQLKYAGKNLDVQEQMSITNEQVVENIKPDIGLEQIQEQPVQEEIQQEQIIEEASSEQEELYTSVKIPSHTIDWFHMERIHTVEQTSLPEFFRGNYPSKTPSVYKEYRDFMIELYRQSPSTYLTGTTCRRHLSGDVCAILRVHAFLEKWGLINFSVSPENKPYNFALLKESSYNKVFINSANKQFLTKNENEFLGNIFDASHEASTHVQEQSSIVQEEQFVPADTLLDSTVLRKINLMTAKNRPFCSFCQALVGFSWHHYDQPSEEELQKESPQQNAQTENGVMYEQPEIQPPKRSPQSYDLCQQCFDSEKFPPQDVEFYSVESVSKEHWDSLEKNAQVAQTTQAAQSQLTNEQKTDLVLSVVSLSQQDAQIDWKEIANKVGLKGAAQAMQEFFKLNEADLQKSLKYHKLEQKPKNQLSKNFDEVSPFCQIDNYFFQCSLLKKFASSYTETTQSDEKSEQVQGKRTKKAQEKMKRKLATKMMLGELKAMRSEFKSLVSFDNSIAKIKNECRNFQVQLFAERVSMTIAGRKTN